MKKTTRQVTLQGIRPIMFDRYLNMSGQEMSPEQKFYLAADGKSLVLPAANISSFLSADLTESATKRVVGRSWRGVAKAALSFVDIDPIEIPFTRNGEPLTIENSNYLIDYRVAKVKKTGGLIIPSEKVRPVLQTPWGLCFKITLYENAELSEPLLRKIFEDGGISIGLGTFRGVFGKFKIVKWE
jgi:hypothetical protein